jgi:hypothetical protein
MRFARTRLSDKHSCFRPRKVVRARRQLNQPQVLVEELIREARTPRACYLVFLAQPPTQPLSNVLVQRVIRGAHRAPGRSNSHSPSACGSADARSPRHPAAPMRRSVTSLILATIRLMLFFDGRVIAKSLEGPSASEGFNDFVTSIVAPIATGWSDSCRAGFAPAERQRLCTAHEISGLADGLPPPWRRVQRASTSSRPTEGARSPTPVRFLPSREGCNPKATSSLG